MERPQPDEFDPYYGTYIDKVPEGPILQTLERQAAETQALLARIGEEGGGRRYAPGKWSVKEVVGHLIDVERVFAFRALWFARRDPTPQPGMEQDDWVAAAGFDRRPLAELAVELRSVRLATLSLFHGLTDEEGRRRGFASERPFSVRAIAWIIAGHELHHRGVLEERYLTE